MKTRFDRGYYEKYYHDSKTAAVSSAEMRARALATENETRLAAGEAERLPEENYYGWLINEKLGELKTLF